MGNRKRSREVLNRQEELDAIRRLLTQPRSLTEDVHLRGIGIRSIQIWEKPSFDDGCVWEVRQWEENWALYRSTINVETSLVHGYDQLGADPSALAAAFADLCGVTISLKPDRDWTLGVDGTTYQIAFGGDIGASWRFRWWEEPPASWRPLTDLADRLRAEFKRLPVVPSWFALKLAAADAQRGEAAGGSIRE